MFENAGQLRRNALYAADWDAKLAVVESSGPGGRAGHVEECLLGVKRDGNVVMGRVTQVAHQVVIFGVESGQQVAAEIFGSIFAFEVEVEVGALVLRKVGFGGGFALGAGKILADRGIGAQDK